MKLCLAVVASPNVLHTSRTPSRCDSAPGEYHPADFGKAFDSEWEATVRNALVDGRAQIDWCELSGARVYFLRAPARRVAGNIFHLSGRDDCAFSSPSGCRLPEWARPRACRRGPPGATPIERVLEAWAPFSAALAAIGDRIVVQRERSHP
jgi:hypothetical protein